MNHKHPFCSVASSNAIQMPQTQNWMKTIENFTNNAASYFGAQKACVDVINNGTSNLRLFKDVPATK